MSESKKQRDAKAWKEQIEQEINTLIDSCTLEEVKLRSTGCFFSTLDDLWSSEKTEVNQTDNSWYAAIVRTPAQGQKLYPDIVDDKNLEFGLVDSKVSSSATNTSQNGTSIDLFRNSLADKAHLIPNASICHQAYGYVAEAATGKINDNKADRRLKLLSGVKDGKRRINNTGIKHHKYNKFHLKLQAGYYDKRPPSIMTIPLLGLDAVLDWNGETEYNVMAITFGEEKKNCQYDVLQHADKIPKDRVIMDVEKGRKLLEAFVKALAYSALKHTVDECFRDRTPRNNSILSQWMALLRELRHQTTPKSVVLPKKKENIDWSNVHVAFGKARLESSLPDPFLMAVKAAINYSSHCNMALLPACHGLSETSSYGESDGEVNTIQGKEMEYGPDNEERDFLAIARSFQNPNRNFVEMFSSDD